MRHTQPLTAGENRIDQAMRRQHRTHAAQDEALTLYRLAVQTQSIVKRSAYLERCADRLVERAP